MESERYDDTENWIEVDIKGTSSLDATRYEVIKVPVNDIAYIRQEFIEDNNELLIENEDDSFTFQQRPSAKFFIGQLLDDLESIQSSTDISQIDLEAIEKTIFQASRALTNFSIKCNESLMNAPRMPYDSPLRVLGGLMAHDMVNHSVNDLVYTMTYLSFGLSNGSDDLEGMKNVVQIYTDRIKRHWSSLGKFFISFQDLLEGRSVTAKDLMDTFPQVQDPDLFTYKDVVFSDGGDGSNIEIKSLYEFADLRTILLNAMEAKARKNLYPPKDFKNIKSFETSPIVVDFVDNEQNRVFTVTDNTPITIDENGNNSVDWFATEQERDNYIDAKDDRKLPPSKESLTEVYNSTEKTYVGKSSKGGLGLVVRNLKVIKGSFNLTSNLEEGTKSVVLTFPKTTPSSNPSPQV
ncbi:hypothetical protein KC678_01145 [Candidatus Dojkabacteria bacterium]|uniref:Uncharacterized protein n=1 Tax=Candidatus Dojkabacteria bacterium TaxID=2099670 RepID=A0A955IF03_9BACT|nr:hypothetical protein [Candidatus Dojkabacteria bacterium]